MPLSAYRLPRGRHGLPRERVAENQRLRLLVAGAEVSAERGYARITSRAIAAVASVSAGSFYEHFDDVGACLLAAHSAAADCVWEVVSEACAGGGEWATRLRAALDAALGFLVSDPDLAWTLGAEARAADARIAAARENLIERLAELVRDGSADRRQGAPETRVGVERHLLAGAFAFLFDRLAAGEVAGQSELGSELAELLTLPPPPPLAR